MVRGGTTSVGLTAAAIAKNHGEIFVGATTRRKENEGLIKESGADTVYIDDGKIATQVKDQKFDKCLELIGTTTLQDSLRCLKVGGIVCMMGMVGNKWSFDNFSPMETIPSTVCLTTYDGGVSEWMETPMADLVKEVEEGRLKVRVGKVFPLEQIVEAHRTMEENQAGGKIVVLT